MILLCSIFTGNQDEVSEAPWKRKNSPPSPPPAPRANLPEKDTSAEVARLRLMLDEQGLLMERKAKEAWDGGFSAGDAAARKSLEEQVRTTVEGLARTVAEVSSIRLEALRSAESDTVRLAMEIARRVLHRELSVNVSALEALTRAAIEKLQTQEIYRVRVHPDLDALTRTCLEQSGRGSAVEIIIDRTQPKGGVSFEISRGTLDSSVETQLREIENGLTDELRRRA